VPVVGGLKLAELERKHVVALLDRKVDAGYPKQAGEVLKVVRKMLNFAVERGEIPINPAVGVKAPAKSPPRRRVLVTEKSDEFGGLFRALKDAPMHPGMKLAVEFQLLTAQRPGAVRGARWGEIDRKAKTWTVPAERMKRARASPWSDLPNVVPLSAEALAVIERADALTGDSEYVFPGRDEGKPWSDTAIDHELHRETMLARLKEQSVARFNLHDLRRTATTTMAAAGVLPHIVDRVLGHVPSGVTSEVYDIHEYIAEKRSALEVLGARIARMKARRPRKADVLPMKRARRG
jgi:integrase